MQTGVYNNKRKLKTCESPKELIMDKLVCSLCGCESSQKRFKYKDINEHFEKAYQIWCPRNCCKEQYNRNVPQGYVCNWWDDYGGWYTVEKKPNVISIDDARSIQKAKMLRDIGLQILQGKENIK